MFTFQRYWQMIFPSICTVLYSTSSVWEFHLFHILANNCYLASFHFSRFGHILALIRISLMTDEWAHVQVFFGHSYSLLWNMCNVLSFPSWLSFFSYWFVRVLYVFWILILWGLCLCVCVHVRVYIDVLQISSPSL